MGKIRVVDAALIIAAALIVTRTYVGRAPAPPREAGDSLGVNPAHWRAASTTGNVLGHPGATDTVVEFMDFQCPFCRVFATQLDSVLKSTVPVTIVVQHYPLPSHPSAVKAAVVSECAARQGRFGEMYSAMFQRQDEIGRRPWLEFAKDAGVPELNSFAACIELPADSFPRIAQGTEIGRTAGVVGTPTVWINGVARKWKPAVAQLGRRR